MKIYWLYLPVLACVFLGFPGLCYGQERVVQPISLQLPIEQPPIQLEHVVDLSPSGPGKENSGIVKSRQWPDVYWIQNDSGDEPRIYAVNGCGEDYVKSRHDKSLGVFIGGAINVDWEDLAVDSAGNVIIADVGNNWNNRRDLTLYYVREPSPEASRSALFSKLCFYYPQQTRFPAPEDDFNYDCEAIFTIGEDVYLLTKHRSDTLTRMYRINPKMPQPIEAELQGVFESHGQVVAADCSPDGRRLIVATYEYLWLFERESLQQSFFEGDISWAKYRSKQVEAVCFRDEDTLLMADEQLGRLYSAKLHDFTPIARRKQSPKAGGDPSSEKREYLLHSSESSERAITLPTVEDLEAIKPGAWTLAVLPDTQYYVDETRRISPTPEVFQAMTEWLAAQREARNIRLVLHVGDIVDNNTLSEWTMAKQALQPLNGVLPCILTTGNHDYEGNAKQRQTLFNDIFGPATDSLIDPKYGGILRETFEAGSLENAAYEFTAPDGRQILILALEWGTRDSVVEWANQVASDEKYEDHTGILLTHAYLYHDNARYDWQTKGDTQASNPLSYGTASSGDNNDGQMLWDKLVRLHANFQLVFCGHVTGSKEELMTLGDEAEVGYLLSPGRAGNQVHQFLFNAQRQGDAGDGWLRLLEFQPDGRSVIVKTYSPWRDARGLSAWRTDADDFFEIRLRNF